MPRYLSKFLYVLQGKHKTLGLLIVLFLLVSFMEMLGIGLIGPFMAIATTPGFIGQHPFLNSIYQQLGFTAETQFLLLCGLLIIAIFYLKAFSSFSVQKFIFNFGFTHQGDLYSRLLRAYLRAPYTFHLNRNTATLVQNITIETAQFCNSVMMPLLVSLSNGVMILAIVGLLIYTDAIATATISGILFLAYLLIHSFKDKMSQLGVEGSEANTEVIRIINHSMGGLKESRIIGCEAYFENQMDTEASRFAKAVALAVSLSTLPRYVIEAMLMTFLIGFTFIFLLLNQNSPQSLNSILGIFAIASVRLLPATSNLMSSINGIRYASYSLDKLYLDLKELESVGVDTQSGFLLTHTGLQPISSDKKTIPFKEEITLDRVAYQYPGSSTNSLNAISLKISKGQSIGLIGRSGAGKTTLVDVILGLLLPQSGDILVDQASIYNDLRSWQNMIGYVPQSIFLTDDTLERNIAFGVPDREIDQNKLLAAVEAAQLVDLVKQLPEGLQTALGERGVRLSGGQRQRVGIARALYHEREVLVLDEATAALDNETEQLVTEAIKALGGKKTIIIIAHRLSTIEHCDRIYMLEGGHVVKSGSFQEVVGKPISS